MNWLQILILVICIGLLGRCNDLHTRRTARRWLRRLIQEQD